MITIIKARVRLTKAHRRTAGGWHTDGYGNAHWVAIEQAAAADIYSLGAVIEALRARPTACVIRGEPLPGVDWSRTLRRFKKEPHTFREEPRQWLMVDADDLKEPPMASMVDEPEACAEYARGFLPAAFHDATCYWQASASAGIKPGSRVHLWFWLSRPISSGQAKTWLRRCPFDRAIYTPIQPHYTATPIFPAGDIDPILRRGGFLAGCSDTVDVPHRLQEPSRMEVQPARFGGTDADFEAVAEAIRTNPAVRQIWTGRREYADRSTAHFAFGCALAKAGVRDPDTILGALEKLDVKHRRDTSKILRTDYAARTVGAILDVTA